ncbi:glycosyltransferase [uncultured Sphingomonas sp.]|uniref:glycosyltransferase n=1 Tax=uncultured Sphingomonas sp. TaxID=158754 RepID=UPI0025FD63B7|nr:glycosyltransferase [uncultured Sphingomonas sp.]
MRAAIHLHLFYPDIALDLIDRVARLGRADIDVLATYVDALDPAVDRALDAIPGRVSRIAVPNHGWDIGPLLHLLPVIAEEGYDAVCHLHTKKGDSGFAENWRRMGYDGTIAGEPLVADILATFDSRPDLMLLGAKSLYKSAAAHQFRNAEIISALAPSMLAPYFPLADWGFFAGTFFWARPALLERVARVADFGGDHGERDGTQAHALERLFGLAAIADGGSVGTVEDGAIAIAPAPGYPSHEPIINTLALYRGRDGMPAAPDAELSSAIAARNPLADYLRHGRDADALDPNPYFNSRWYNRVNGDAFAAGMHPLDHYLLHGWSEERSPGPLFDSRHYRRTHAVTGDPLRHFLEEGVGRGLSPAAEIVNEPRDQRPRRFYRRFDVEAEVAFLRRMVELPAALIARAGATKVSVIMPAFNREGVIAASIRSVLAQTHANLELIVIDDGSTDGTADEVRRFQSDPRVVLLGGEHAGISAARNLGLAHATGEIVAYLDSDNRWNGWFLEVMTRFLAADGLDAGYSAISLRDDAGQLTGYIGDHFDWEACLEQNYIDLNAFCHRRALLEEVGAFDPRLRRMVDWDLILRIGRDRTVGFAPFLGCDYSDAKFTKGRITTSEPAAFLRLVWTKNRHAVPIGSPDYMAKLRLRFAIKIAAPEEEKDAWGDWHFAESLADAIRRLGHDCEVDFRHHWHDRSIAHEDVVIALRGLIPYEPRPGQYAVMWNISHPDQVGYDEYDRFSRVYVASNSYAEFLDKLVAPPVTPLLQATDPDRFHPVAEAERIAGPLFVGNSRGVERDIVRWAMEAEARPAIYGGGWEGLVPVDRVKGSNVDNRELGRLYAGADAVLNDHWPSMAAFGLLSNRMFDVVAAGGRLLTDPVPSLAATFGQAAEQVTGAAALRAELARPRRPDPRDVAAVAQHHSFDARATVIVGDALTALGLPVAFERGEARPLPSAPAAPRAIRVHIIAAHGSHGPQSSAFIRLVAPLTDDRVAGRVRLSLAPASDPVPPCDICIVQRAAMPDVAAVDGLVRTLGAMSAALVVDVDDAFLAIGPDHPEAAIYRPLNAAIERAIAASAESWFSTAPLAHAYAHVAHRHAVMPNAIDPRIWRDWRHPRPEPFHGDKVRMLYMGTATHGADFAMIRPALERLHEERRDRFELTLVGVSRDVEGAHWLRRASPPADAIPYPRFARWLRGQGPFDLGLAPLTDSDFNRGKSDIKLLDYAALRLLPVVSDCPAYRADPAMGRHAVFAGDWFETLRHVIDHRDEARDMAKAAHDHLWAHRTVGDSAEAMVARLEALL